PRAGTASAAAPALISTPLPAALSATGGVLRGRHRRRGIVGDPPGLTSVRLQLGLDPVNRLSVAFGSFAAITKRRQPLDRGFVFIELQPADQRAHVIALRFPTGSAARLACRRWLLRAEHTDRCGQECSSEVS